MSLATLLNHTGVAQTSLQRRWSAFMNEAGALAQALLAPRAVLAEMEQVHRLLARARTVEVRDAQAASELRRRASRIGRP